MKRNMLKHAYWATVVVLAVASAALSPYNIAGLIPTPRPRPGRHLQPVLLPGLSPLRQAQHGRDIRALHYQLLRSFPVTLGISPGRILKSPRETLLVLDINDSTVKEYGQTGHLLARYSSSFDDFPGKIADFTISNDGTVWTTDPNGSIRAITSEGKTVTEIPDTHAMRLAWADDRLLLSTVASKALKFGDHAFVAVDQKGTVLSRFGDLVSDYPTMGIVMSGEMAYDPLSRKLLYAPTALGLLASYSPDGGMNYLVETIEPGPIPQIEISARGATHISRPTIRARSLATFNGKIFILSRDNVAGGASRSLVDVYDQKNGVYRYSFELPVAADRLAVWDHTVCTASQQMLSLWHLDADL
jgi:outer membrane protein assembly factor BamB